MSGPKVDDRTAEVSRLGLVEGVGVRAIARRLRMARKTVRQILGRSAAMNSSSVMPSATISAQSAVSCP
jgi:hypothetical protein